MGFFPDKIKCIDQKRNDDGNGGFEITEVTFHVDFFTEGLSPSRLSWDKQLTDPVREQLPMYPVLHTSRTAKPLSVFETIQIPHSFYNMCLPAQPKCSICSLVK